MTTAKVPLNDLASWIGSNPKIALKVVELIEQGNTRTKILDWLCDEYRKDTDAPKLPEYLLMDDEYLTDFHKQWNEACVKELVRTKSMRFTAEYARAQSRRLESAVWLCEEREGWKRNRRK
jgi:hypothetical protein